VEGVGGRLTQHLIVMRDEPGAVMLSATKGVQHQQLSV
jgi:hypothetical protein